MRIYLYIFIVLFAASGCSERAAETVRLRSSEVSIDVARAGATRALVLDAEIAAGGADVSDAILNSRKADTRTEIVEDGFSLKWSGDDRIALWAQSEGGAYAFEAQPFSLFEYILANEARFTGNIPPMADGSYRYYASSPLPVRAEGSRAVYTVPAVQDGTYRSEYDLLVSDPVEGPQLGADANRNPRMTMRHLCHALRIRIPEGRNRWGKPVDRLLVEFPASVTGELTFDVSDPEATMTLTGGTNAVELQFPAAWDESPADAPRYAWVFVAPGRLDGRIDFTPLFDDGYCAETLSTPVLSKSLEAGHITPVTLTISDTEQTVTWIDFEIDHSQLGEPVNTLSIKAPEGAFFRGNLTAVDLEARDGKYSVGYYAKFYQEAFDGASMAASYDSDNAVVANTISVGRLAPDSRNTVNVKAPWLFYEDFGGKTDFEYKTDAHTANPSGISLDTYGFDPGWTGTRLQLSNGAMRISVRHETVAQYPGRVDTPPLKNIKADRSVNVKVLFNGGKDNKYVFCTVGTITDPSAMTGDKGVSQNSQKLDLDEINNISYTNIPNEYNFTVNSVNDATRISWVVERTYNFTGNGWISRTWYMYLDNIRVSIVR